MPAIHYQGQTYQCRDDETVLDALLRQGVDIPFSCRHGICHVCMHRSDDHNLPTESQRGLSDEQRAQGYFLPCRCTPHGDLVMHPKCDKGKENSGLQSDTAPGLPTEPDPEMWQALQEGALLSRILEDFYTQVFEDPRLSPYFHGVTRQRAIEKVHSFLRQKFTGEKIYFGDRPRNAHHWMVISDELFDYREKLMVETLRRHHLPEHLIARWRQLEEHFRPDIVKDTPWKRRIGDVEIPVEGYDEIELEVGSICDGCESEINVGVRVRYHLRLGTIYCPSCMANPPHDDE